MPVTNYYSVGGELLGEETGGVRRDYLTDALGSVTATVTSAGAIENTYRYKPYGALLSKTGSASDPAFTWVGKWGYRQTAKTFSDVYIRARHYSSTSSNWTSFDKLVETKNKYNYAECSPLQLIDYDGKLAMRATTAPEAGASAIVGAGCNSAYFVTQYLNPMLIEHGFAVQHVIYRFRGFDGRNKFMSELPNFDAWESFKIEGGKYEEDKDIFNIIWTRGRVRTRGCFRIIGFTKVAAQSPEFMHKNNWFPRQFGETARGHLAG